MTKLIYLVITSLDGYIEDQQGKFDWAEPDEEVHTFINDLMRPVSTYLYGRKMYETMAVWETEPSLAEMSPYSADFAQIWQAANKVVYSTTQEKVWTERTRLEKQFNPDEVQRLKAASSSDLAIGGPALAVSAFRANLVDECLFFLTPVVVGGGKPAMPRNSQINLELLDERRFESGMVYIRYRIAH